MLSSGYNQVRRKEEEKGVSLHGPVRRADILFIN